MSKKRSNNGEKNKKNRIKGKQKHTETTAAPASASPTEHAVFVKGMQASAETNVPLWKSRDRGRWDTASLEELIGALKRFGFKLRGKPNTTATARAAHWNTLAVNKNNEWRGIIPPREPSEESAQAA